MTQTSKTNPLLPDYISHDLRCLSVGLNPSILSAQEGFYFANPRNRFWRAFSQANIIATELSPDRNIHKILLREYSLGFTDVVKRPSRMGHELHAQDFRRDAPLLYEKIEIFMPRLLWFHGKVAANKFLNYGLNLKCEIKWGMNNIIELGVPLFVSPNPSAANASYSLADLVYYYKILAKKYIDLGTN